MRRPWARTRLAVASFRLFAKRPIPQRNSCFFLCVRPWATRNTHHAHHGGLRAGTIVSHEPSTTTANEILSSILPTESPLKSPKSSSGVLLCTRAFAALASDAEFLTSFTNRLAGTNDLGRSNTLDRSVNLLSAVIDHVPSPNFKSGGLADRSSRDALSTPPSAPDILPNGIEGITYLFDTDGDILDFEMLAGVSQTSGPTESSNDELGLLSFRMPNLKVVPAGIMTVQLPLANTLFVSGTRSTMILSQWRINVEANSFKNTGAAPVANFTINIRDTNEPARKQLYFPNSLHLHIPLKPLTPPRIVADSSGNIVRRLRDEVAGMSQGGSQPASHELEQAVAKHFSDQQLPPQPISVWASVVAGDQISHFDSSRVLSGAATLHRVLSGGGGWGENAGLISLDHHADFGSTSSSKSEGKAESFENGFGGAIAPPGYGLRFYVRDSATSPLPKLSNGVSHSTTLESIISFGLGVSQASDEDVSFATAKTPNTSTETPLPHTETFNGQFGALSELGIALSQSLLNGGASSRSKIDVPNTWLSFKISGSDASSKINFKNSANENPHPEVNIRKQPVREASTERAAISASRQANAASKARAVALHAARHSEIKDQGKMTEKHEQFPNHKFNSKNIAVRESNVGFDQDRKAATAENQRARQSRVARKVGQAKKLLRTSQHLDSSPTTTPTPKVDGTEHEKSTGARQKEIFNLFDEVMGQPHSKADNSEVESKNSSGKGKPS